MNDIHQEQSQPISIDSFRAMSLEEKVLYLRTLDKYQGVALENQLTLQEQGDLLTMAMVMNLNSRANPKK